MHLLVKIIIFERCIVIRKLHWTLQVYSVHCYAPPKTCNYFSRGALIVVQVYVRVESMMIPKPTHKLITSSSTDPNTTSTLICLSIIIFQKSMEVSASGCCVNIYSALLPRHYQYKEQIRDNSMHLYVYE